MILDLTKLRSILFGNRICMGSNPGSFFAIVKHFFESAPNLSKIFRVTETGRKKSLRYPIWEKMLIENWALIKKRQNTDFNQIYMRLIWLVPHSLDYLELKCIQFKQKQKWFKMSPSFECKVSQSQRAKIMQMSMNGQKIYNDDDQNSAQTRKNSSHSWVPLLHFLFIYLFFS